MARRHATDNSEPSVSRVAYVGGLSAGIMTAVAGYYLVPYWDLGTLGSTLVEFGCVILAFAIAKGIWKFSDWRHQLDTTSRPHDGTEV